MKDIGEGTIRRIDWTELVPAVLLLRIFSTALGLRILGIAVIGGMLWQISDIRILSVNRSNLRDVAFGTFDMSYNENIFRYIFSSILNVFDKLSPPQSLFFHSLYSDLWDLFGDYRFWESGLLCLICGTAICRIAAVRLTIDESESNRHLCRFVLRRCGSIVNAVFILTVGILLCYLPVYAAGKLLTVPVAGVIAEILLPVPMLFALLTVILIIGLVAGLPLLFAAVCTDASDGFDAVSRTFSYIYQRPLHYVLYWIYSAVLGYLGYLLVWYFVVLAASLLQGAGIVIANAGGQTVFAQIWILIGLQIPAAYQIAWFFTSGTAIYLLLRRSVDAAPFNEVYRTEPVKMRYLPKIQDHEIQKSEIQKNDNENGETV